MKRFVEGEDRLQGVLLPEFLDDYVAEDNLVRVIEVTQATFSHSLDPLQTIQPVRATEGKRNKADFG